VTQIALKKEGLPSLVGGIGKLWWDSEAILGAWGFFLCVVNA